MTFADVTVGLLLHLIYNDFCADVTIRLLYSLNLLRNYVRFMVLLRIWLCCGRINLGHV